MVISATPNAKSLLQPSAIDVTRLPEPEVLETLSYEALQQAYIDRFLAEWAVAKAEAADELDLPDYDVDILDSDPVMIASQAFSFVRMLDRARVNDAAKALLAAYATGTDLDALVARQNLTRLDGENDVQLLRRYLLSFERAAAGSRSGLLFRAFTAAPSLHDCEVNGQAVHGRLGDVDIVIATSADGSLDQAVFDAVHAALSDEEAFPEATTLIFNMAETLSYPVRRTVHVPGGIDAALVKVEVEARLTAATSARAFIGASVPADYLTGACYGANVIDVTGESADVIADRYQMPVAQALEITVEVAS